MPPIALAADDFGLSDGIQAYRDGDYSKAEKTFQQGHQQHPEDSRVTYYLAITEAQLGRFKQAKSLYQEILTLDPNSEAAQLAKEGLSYLPTEEGMDKPPRFQGKKQEQVSDPGEKTAMAPTNQLPTTQNGMTPQDMMMWQAVMGQMGGNNQQQGGMNNNPWAYMMMPQATGDPNNPPKIDPSVMSNLLMNQMMQNFTLGGNSEENR